MTDADVNRDNLECLHCGYSLRGLPGDPIRCPECGTDVPVAGYAQAWHAQSRRRRRGSLRGGDVSQIGVVGVLFGMVSYFNNPLMGLAAAAAGAAVLFVGVRMMNRGREPHETLLRMVAEYYALMLRAVFFGFMMMILAVFVLGGAMAFVMSRFPARSRGFQTTLEAIHAWALVGSGLLGFVACLVHLRRMWINGLEPRLFRPR
ncbi:MAG: hypothetical protein JXO22_12855 [Phycisphaerae bacterium]|nr:hypothetical protein [Phycisphaerae bacterium]